MSVRVASNGWMGWGVLVLFFGMWLFVSYIIAHGGGWIRLASRYRATGPAPRSLRRFASAQLGVMSYRACLNVGVDEHGLYLVPMWLFRAFHPSLRIPWSEIRARTKDRLFFFAAERFDLGPEMPMLLLRSRATRDVDAYLPFSTRNP
ncbi:hypothetical protein LZ198_03120 [Myxococcus sp. K15C18031901]|uniref:hypothetical protein n=1 Tax=Myxococcus dinghuensis TaxID=2906761 RepID=UPI0020A6E099|nr:hypothetical protein [Myxococcus dinghuensis]MCP3097862.1 hypothetical protein [Myxococcus dinghuensis]